MIARENYQLSQTQPFECLQGVLGFRTNLIGHTNYAK
jgi:hypothetical protein